MSPLWTLALNIAGPLISAAAAIIVCQISGRQQHERTLGELEKANTMQAYRIEQLEKKVDKHNNLIERTYKLEQAAAVTEEKIKVANHRLEDLEKNKTE